MDTCTIEAVEEKAIETPIEGTPYRLVEANGCRKLMVKGDDRYSHGEMQLSMPDGTPDGLMSNYLGTMLQALPLAPRLDDILLIGLGCGEQTKFLYRRLPATRLVTVEIDPYIVAIARSYFCVPPDDERHSVVIADGRDYIEMHPNSCDVLLCDGYDQSFTIPDSLAGEEFYRSCYLALRPGGVMALNKLHSRSHEWWTDHLQMLGRIFAHGLQVRVDGAQSVILLFKNAPDDCSTLMQRAQRLEGGLELGLPKFIDHFELMRQRAR
ncbi:MAG TPA: methyltransferase domain-containing protein [Noviherbaspirillum sp.]